MFKIVEPVLINGSRDHLREELLKLPIKSDQQKYFIHLEALGRSLCGIAPWLENREGVTVEELAKKEYFSTLARKAIANIVNPHKKDYANIDVQYPQPLVDAAFLAQGILRAKNALWHAFDPSVQEHIITFCKRTRAIRPWRSNWILFSAMIETFLHEVQAEPSYAVIDYALSQFEQWYVGDGMYKDGPMFHMDYYNSFVIHPMLLDISKRMRWARYETYLARSQRYAEILYRLINSDGTYPLIGRSITYRMGAFHLLSQLAYQKQLGALPESKVRCALTAVLKRIMSSSIFTPDGWLKTGVAGKQTNLAEAYINTGSLYLCLTFFLPLGLPPDNSFWTSPDEDWASVQLWNGRNLPADHAKD